MIEGVLAVVALFGFVAAQGGVVFATAWLIVRALRMMHWMAKPPAMVVSYVAWATFTVCAYLATGGSASILHGFAIVLMICVSAAVSSILYLFAWLLWPLAGLALHPTR